VVLLHHRIAEGRLDAPQPEDHGAPDAKILLDAREQGAEFPQAFLAGLDAPVGDTAVDVLPELLVELRLAAHLLEDGQVRLQVAEHPIKGRVGNALGGRACPQAREPGLEGLRCLLRVRDTAERERGGARSEGEQVSAREIHRIALQPNHGEDSAARAGHLLPWGKS
jgi:hypothetical protein